MKNKILNNKRSFTNHQSILFTQCENTNWPAIFTQLWTDLHYHRALMMLNTFSGSRVVKSEDIVLLPLLLLLLLFIIARLPDPLNCASVHFLEGLTGYKIRFNWMNLCLKYFNWTLLQMKIRKPCLFGNIPVCHDVTFVDLWSRHVCQSAPFKLYFHPTILFDDLLSFNSFILWWKRL